MPTPECYEDLGAMKAEIQALQKWRMDFEKREIDRLKMEGFANGALWALAKVGVIVVTVLGAFGWVAVNGIPLFIKQIFR